MQAEAGPLFIVDRPLPKSAAAITLRALWLAATALMGVTLIRTIVALWHGSGLTHESGVLTGLAMDLRDGLLYRPLVGPAGYGGTRYGPLHVLLHAGLMKLGLGPLVSGHLITIASAIALGAGLYLLLRRLSVRRELAMPAAVLFLAGAASQFAVMTIRADLLPAALNVFGLALVAGDLNGSGEFAGRRRRLYAAAGFFALAFVAKVTTIFGLAAVVGVLLFRRHYTAAILLSLTTILFTGIFLAIVNVCSHGRLLENFIACSAGGRPMKGLHEFLDAARIVLLGRDRMGTAIVLIGLAAFAWVPFRAKIELPGLFLMGATGVSLVLLRSPGIDRNHLVDVEVAAIVFVVVQAARSRLSFPLGIGSLALVALVAAMIFLPELRKDRYARRQTLISLVREGTANTSNTGAISSVQPMLSDNALLPVLVGQRPFLLDDFMLPAIREKVPELQDDLYRRLDEGFFSAVLLRYDPQGSDRPWVFGKRFAEKIRKRYELVDVHTGWDHIWVYRRKPESAVALSSRY